jgi:hypothetical protein
MDEFVQLLREWQEGLLFLTFFAIYVWWVRG